MCSDHQTGIKCFEITNMQIRIHTQIKYINKFSLSLFFQSGGLPINFGSMCLQWAKISCLLLSVAKCGFRTILNFSLTHNLQIFVTGLYVGIFFPKFSIQLLGLPLPPSLSKNGWIGLCCPQVCIHLMRLYVFHICF